MQTKPQWDILDPPRLANVLKVLMPPELTGVRISKNPKCCWWARKLIQPCWRAVGYTFKTLSAHTLNLRIVLIGNLSNTLL